MTSGPNDQPPDEGTVIIPAGQQGRGAAAAEAPPTPAAPPLVPPGSTGADWPGDDRTTVIQPGQSGTGPAASVEPTIFADAPGAAEETTTVFGPEAELANSGPEAPIDLTPGTILGNYKVGKMIARGGLGAIYDGVNIHNPAERVAIKTILPEPGLGERFAKMLLDEANALMRVRHDAVVPYRTYGRIGTSDEFYLVLEFLDGDALNDFYRRRRLNERELFSLARRLAAGLQASHEEGLIHRDVSPDNVLLQNNQLDKATLIDFGIAKLGDIEELPDAQFAGKLSYAAPEQFVRGARIGPWTDAYSLALLLIAAARGQPLPMGKTLEEAQEARREIPELKGVPPALIGPLRKMLEPHPPDRPQSMVEVMALLDEAERNAAGARSPGPSASAPPGADTRRGGKAGIRRIDTAVREPESGGIGRSLLSAALALLIGGGVVAGVMVFGDDLFGSKTQEPGATGAGPGTGTDPGTGDGDTDPQPTPPPPSPDRAEELAKVTTEFRSALAASPCTLARVDGSDSGTAYSVAVTGTWADDARVKSLTADTAGKTGASASAVGAILDRSLCATADQLKPAGELGAPSLASPKATGAEDRSVVFDMTPDPAARHVVLFEADAGGKITQLLDMSPERRAQLLADKRIEDRGNGSYRVTLVPHGLNDNRSQTLLVAVTSPNEPPGPGMAVRDWATAIAATKGVIDAVPREGVAPVAPPPPNQTRPELMEAARQAVLTRLGTMSCAAVRVAASDDGQAFTIRVGGVWGDFNAMQAAIAEVATATGARIELDGRVVDNALCLSVDAFKKVAAELGPAALGAPQPSAEADRASFVSIAPVGGKQALYLFEAERSGKVRGLLNLGTAEARSNAISGGLAEDLGEGRLQVKLVPPTPESNVDSTMLVLLAGATPPSGFSFPAETDLTGLLQSASQFGAKDLAIDLIERPGVAPPSGPVTPDDPLAPVRQSFRDVACSMIRLEASGGGTNVFGLWGDEKPVKIAADLAAEQMKSAFTLAGDRVSGDLCPFVDKLKPFFGDMEPVSILKPQPTGQPDRSVSVQVIADPTYPYLYFYAIDPDGRVDSIIELSNEGKLAAAVNAGLIEAPGNGRYRITLPPYSQDNDKRSSMLMTVMSKQRLEAALFEFRGAIPFGGWLAGLGDFAKAAPLRVDVVEYVQVPP